MTPDQINFLHAVAPLAMGHEFPAAMLAEAAGLTRDKACRVAAQLTNGSTTFIARTHSTPAFYKSSTFHTHYAVFCKVSLKMEPEHAWTPWRNAVGGTGILFLVAGRYVYAANRAFRAHPDRFCEITPLPSREARVFVEARSDEQPEVTFTRAIHLLNYHQHLREASGSPQD